MKNKIVAIIVSVVLSFSLWLYVTTVVSPESEMTYYDIPVILENENVLAERGLMITSDIPTITLRLKGTRTDLNNLNESNINILASVSGILAPGEHFLRYDPSYPGSIPASAVEIISSNMDLIPITVENKLKKSVQVVVNFPGSVTEGYIANKDNAILDYKTIEISGPESVVSQVEQAIVEVNMEGRKETFAEQFPFTLCNSEGEPVDVAMVTTNTESVNVSVQIQRYMDVELTVQVVDGGGATSKTCDITINPNPIRISGSDALLDKITTIELGSIDLSGILKDGTLTFPIVLPEGVTNETGVTEATVDVKFPDLKTKSFNVTKIVTTNVPEGLEVEMITQALEVKVRGPIALVDSMKESHITATVDFTGAQIGTATIKATISIDEDFKEVGALNTYSVSATLLEPVPEETN